MFLDLIDRGWGQVRFTEAYLLQLVGYDTERGRWYLQRARAALQEGQSGGVARRLRLSTRYSL
jgi:hypothetical protein